METHTFYRSLRLCVPGAIMAAVAVAFLPGIFIHTYTADDYIFLAQTMEHGLPTSILIPFGDHFIPLYRLLLGGSHLLFASAIPIRVLSLGFHLLSVYLVFRIVRVHANSTLPAAIASITFGFSVWDATDILRCVNGHWPISLFFVLLMAVFFDSFFDANSNPMSSQRHASAAAETARRSAAEQAPAARADLKYYCAGIACFAVALGTFTNALFGGTIIWLFAYVRLLFMRKPRWSFRDHLKIVLPFILIVAAYLLLRRHFIARYLSVQGTIFQLIRASDSLTLQEKFLAVIHLPPEYFLNALRQLSPYFPAHGFVFLALIILLYGKELAVRRREALTPTAWLAFALAIFFVLNIRAGLLYVTLPGTINPAMPSRYLYFSMAGMSIALGLLLRLPPSWEEAAAKIPPRVRWPLFVLAAGLICVLNYGKFKDLREQSHRFVRQNRRFYQVVTRYRESMQAFLNSPDYSADREYHFMPAPAVNANQYPSGYGVMQSDILHMYFPQVKNISFEPPSEPGASIRVWRPNSAGGR